MHGTRHAWARIDPGIPKEFAVLSAVGGPAEERARVNGPDARVQRPVTS